MELGSVSSWGDYWVAMMGWQTQSTPLTSLSGFGLPAVRPTLSYLHWHGIF